MQSTRKEYVTLSFDIEDWFQVESFKTKFPIETWDSQELRVEKGTEQIINLLDKYNIKATFFVLGWIAEKRPEMIKEIYDRGHEISSHGYCHKLNYNMSSKELYNDLKKSKSIIENIINNKIYGYRAPTFSVSDEVIKVLGQLDYEYDSSFNQFSKHDRYGVLSNHKNEMVFEVSDSISEISLPVTSLYKQEIPIAGGGFFRLYPLWMTKGLIRKHFKTNNYYMFYAHPWEFDPGMPKVNNVGMLNKFRHYVNVKSNYKKLELLINYLQKNKCVFLPARDYLMLNNRGDNKL